MHTSRRLRAAQRLATAAAVTAVTAVTVIVSAVGASSDIGSAGGGSQEGDVASAAKEWKRSAPLGR